MALFANNPGVSWQYARYLNRPFIKTDFLLPDSLTLEGECSFLEEYKIKHWF